MSFRFDLIKGHIAKEMVRGLLEDSGYNAYSFGYESLLSQIRYDVQKKHPSETDSIRRLRSTPDLLVYDEQNGQTWFTEVKFRRIENPKEIALKAKPLVWYQKYWNDSVLVVVIPVEHVFYAQYVSKLGDLKLSNTEGSFDEAFLFDLTKDFVTINQIFPKIKPETTEKYFSLFGKIPIMDVYDYEEEFY